MGLAEFTLSRSAGVCWKAKVVMNYEKERKDGGCPEEVQRILEKVHSIHGYEKIDDQTIDLSSTIYAVKPGDGSARRTGSILSESSSGRREYYG